MAERLGPYLLVLLASLHMALSTGEFNDRRFV